MSSHKALHSQPMGARFSALSITCARAAATQVASPHITKGCSLPPLDRFAISALAVYVVIRVVLALVNLSQPKKRPKRESQHALAFLLAVVFGFIGCSNIKMTLLAQPGCVDSRLIGPSTPVDFDLWPDRPSILRGLTPGAGIRTRRYSTRSITPIAESVRVRPSFATLNHCNS